MYVEPYGGAASVLMLKPRSYAEVYNDLNGNVVNVFRVLRDPELAECLRRALHLTPWARAEFNLSYEPAEDPVERARRTIVQSFMAFGSSFQRGRSRTGFRAKFTNRHQTGARDWIGYPKSIPAFVERLQGVVIEERPALDVIRQQDAPDTLFYVDPPYVPATRSALKSSSSATERLLGQDLFAPRGGET